MKKCPTCGYQNEANARRCTVCGTDLTDLTGITGRPGNHRRPGHRNLVVVLGVIIVAIVAGGAYHGLARSHQSAAKPATSRPRQASSRKVSSHAVSKAVTTPKTAARSSSGRATGQFDAAQVRQIVKTTMASVSGKKSVYVAPISGAQPVVVNNGPQRSASSIKIFVLVTAYQQHQAGKFDFNDQYTVTDADKVGGTGNMQGLAAGTKLSYQEVLNRMINDSDNMGTNVVIDKLGGLNVINAEIQRLGARDTKLQRKMLDTQALSAGKDNYTSVQDLGTVLTKLYNHQLISAQADDAMLAILAKTVNHSKLPKLLPADATVYNKTGEYPDYGVQNDAAIIKNQHGAFVVAVMAQDGQEAAQVAAMNQLGLKLYQTILE